MKQVISLNQIKQMPYTDQKRLVTESGLYDWWKKEYHLLDVEMTNKMLLRICQNTSIGKLIEIIRQYHQMDIYTVDKVWHVQLFELEVAANDNTSCVFETGSEENELIDILFECIVWIYGKETC